MLGNAVSFFAELKRRNVIRVVIAYAAVVWLLLQVADLVLSNLGAPAWIIQALIVSAALGLPVAIVLAWLFDITPEGIKATADLPALEQASASGRKIDFVIIGLLVLAVGFLLADNYLRTDGPRDSSIAVLPFTNLSVSQDESAAFFASGMHDALLTQLSKLGGLRVISRTSVLEYADRPKNVRQIGAELGVATIMEGTVLRAGNNLQINVQLIDAATDEHIWAEIYDRELTAENIFAIQREMATSIAGLLRAKLTPQEQTVLNQVPTQSTRAYDFFLTGNEFAGRPSERQYMPLAIQAYERAVEEDPTFGIAWAALARAAAEDSRFGRDRTPARRAQAAQALERARALAPDAAEVHYAASICALFVDDDVDAAIAEIEMALPGLPGSAELFNALASVYRRADRYEDSIAYRNRAMELDPRNADALLSLGATYARMRDYDAAGRTLDRALEVAPDSAMLYWARAQVPLWRDGDASAFRALAERPPIELGRFRIVSGWLAAIYDRDYNAAVTYLDDLEPGMMNAQNRALRYAQTYWLAGRDDDAEPYWLEVRRIAEAALANDPDDYRNLTRLGAALAGLGELDAAQDAGRKVLALIPAIVDLDAAENARENLVVQLLGPIGAAEPVVEALDALLSGHGLFSIEGLLPDPRLDPVRDDPGFLALVEKYRRPP